jgi:hypothetical protein
VQNLTRAGLSVETEFDTEGAMLFLKIGADGRHPDMLHIGSPTEGHDKRVIEARGLTIE